MSVYLGRRYLRYVKPAFDHFVLPTSRYADIVNRFDLLHSPLLNYFSLGRPWFQ